MSLRVPRFVPFPLLTNAHLMTLAPAFWPRTTKLSLKAAQVRLFNIEPGVQVMAHCFFQTARQRHPTVILVHGLEGSSQAHYIMGTAAKAFHTGFNVVAVNMRNCGGTAHLTPTLYDAGMSCDPINLIRQLSKSDGLTCFFLAGWSLGGNIVLKAAAELAGERDELLRGVCAVSPALDLERCIAQMEQGANRLYELRFLLSLKAKILTKRRFYPDLYDLRQLSEVRSIREFDDRYTAPHGGYGNAANYYRTASALPVLKEIKAPVLIIHSRDDPLVPFSCFESPHLKRKNFELLVTDHGGHAGFLQRVPEKSPLMDRFWAENRVVEFCAALS